MNRSRSLSAENLHRRIRGPRRYTAGQTATASRRGSSPLAFFRPASSPSVCVSGRPWKLNVDVFKPFGFTDGSRKLYAVRSKPFTASLPAPLCYPCPPAAPLREGQRTPHVCAYAYVRVRKTKLLCRYSYSSLGNAFITHERYDSVIESLSCSQRGMVLIKGFGHRTGKRVYARSCGTSMSKATGMFPPPAHKPAALSPYAFTPPWEAHSLQLSDSES